MKTFILLWWEYRESEFMTLVSMYSRNDAIIMSYTLSELQKLTRRVFIMAGKENDGLKYGGIAEKPPNLTRHN